MISRRHLVEVRPALTIGGLAAIVTGLWVLAASLLGAGVGAGVGFVALGLAALVLESLIEEPSPGHAGRVRT